MTRTQCSRVFLTGLLCSAIFLAACKPAVQQAKVQDGDADLNMFVRSTCHGHVDCLALGAKACFFGATDVVRGAGQTLRLSGIGYVGTGACLFTLATGNKDALKWCEAAAAEGQKVRDGAKALYQVATRYNEFFALMGKFFDKLTITDEQASRFICGAMGTLAASVFGPMAVSELIKLEKALRFYVSLSGAQQALYPWYLAMAMDGKTAPFIFRQTVVALQAATAPAQRAAIKAAALEYALAQFDKTMNKIKLEEAMAKTPAGRVALMVQKNSSFPKWAAPLQQKITTIAEKTGGMVNHTESGSHLLNGMSHSALDADSVAVAMFSNGNGSISVSLDVFAAGDTLSAGSQAAMNSWKALGHAVHATASLDPDGGLVYLRATAETAEELEKLLNVTQTLL